MATVSRSKLADKGRKRRKSGGIPNYIMEIWDAFRAGPGGAGLAADLAKRIREMQITGRALTEAYETTHLSFDALEQHRERFQEERLAVMMMVMTPNERAGLRHIADDILCGRVGYRRRDGQMAGLVRLTSCPLDGPAGEDVPPAEPAMQGDDGEAVRMRFEAVQRVLRMPIWLLPALGLALGELENRADDQQERGQP